MVPSKPGKGRTRPWNSQLHDQVEVVGTLVDVFQRHDVLVLDPAKESNVS